MFDTMDKKLTQGNAPVPVSTSRAALDFLQILCHIKKGQFVRYLQHSGLLRTYAKAWFVLLNNFTLT